MGTEPSAATPTVSPARNPLVIVAGACVVVLGLWLVVHMTSMRISGTLTTIVPLGLALVGIIGTIQGALATVTGRPRHLLAASAVLAVLVPVAMAVCVSFDLPVVCTAAQRAECAAATPPFLVLGQGGIEASRPTDPRGTSDATGGGPTR